MNGNKAVLDSNVVVYISKQIIDGNKVISHYNNIFVSVISYMEVLGYEFSSEIEKQLTEDFLLQSQVIHTNSEIAEKVIDFRKKKKIKLPDAIVAATAFVLGADLITANVKDFKGLDKGLKVITPFEKN